MDAGNTGTPTSMDITELILFQHHEQRRTFALLDEIPRDDTAALSAIWGRLEILLEVHAEAEEKFFYPRLLTVGHGASDADSVSEEIEDAIKDHNEIRDAVRKVAGHETGTDDWWQAVTEARVSNSDHMAEEERQDLADFRRHADLQTRHDIAVQFIAYENQHAKGIKPVDKDPEDYVAEHS
ncbi:Hemerythrin HHE cation binding domain-containing protein [Modestobacter sp. DSM 44400]|uniref:hemerythrin domain-containing protein n=1 Tax=Modestobacter sp. DSM 44400 TaxID=1550230 RepID=UPI000894F771|nr:hemerythrin domain-containing protein [Modestobacter sp. DSM 44400]SDY34702.1 Hemerythrin HHE cation binding domain-containing protein [Modestobacter sp. DSM 44400]